MEHVTVWIELSLRWLHIVTGAAWIGTSFYFNWLNNHVRSSDRLEPGVAGDLWSVHGGNFYRVVKYRVAPETLPSVLHWFKWEAYFTWISGFCLLCVVYYLEAETMLIDPEVPTLDQWQAIAIGLGMIVGGWIVYDLMCRSPLGRASVPFAILGFALLVGTAWGSAQVFGSRAAYIHVGALIGTIMAANVFFVIIPNQRIMVGAMTRGEEPEAHYGMAAAQRSLHNNYLTLPVLFIMISNHYPVTFGQPAGWAILAGLMIVGAVTRHWFNLRGQGHKNAYLLPIAAAGMVALGFVTTPKTYANHAPVAFTQIRTIIEKHCIDCHSATPRSPFYQVAPLGVAYDSPAEIARFASRINQQVVVSRVMPLGNMTGMTEGERDLVGAWYHQGAQLK